MRLSTVAAGLILLFVPTSAFPCSGIYAFAKGLALAGNNEDFWNPNTKMWFVPEEGERHGRVYFGFGNMFPQGGMNTAGLFFDGFATRRLPVTKSIGRERFQGNLIDEAMATCGSVDEVKALFERHDVAFLETAMLMFGDKHGGSIIVEGDEILVKEGRDQVCTNFYQSQSDPSDYSCPRYATGRRMLGKSKKISVDLFRRILDAMHVEGRSKTLYSNVYDLTNGVVHLYHFHDFDEVVTLNLEEELAKGARVVDLPSLFPENEAFTRFTNEQQEGLEKKARSRLAKDIDRSCFGEYVGDYEVSFNATKMSFTVSLEGEQLRLASDRSEETVELLPEGEDRFFYIDFDGATAFRFTRGDGGPIAGLVVTSFLGHEYAGLKLP